MAEYTINKFTYGGNTYDFGGMVIKRGEQISGTNYYQINYKILEIWFALRQGIHIIFNVDEDLDTSYQYPYIGQVQMEGIFWLAFGSSVMFNNTSVFTGYLIGKINSQTIAMKVEQQTIIPTSTSQLTNDSLVEDVLVDGVSVVSDGVASITSSGSSSSTPFSGTCSTAAATVAKTVTCPEFTSSNLVKGAIVFVTFTNTNSGSVGSLTLNVNNTGAYPIKYNNSATGSGNIGAASNLVAGSTYPFYFDGSHWMILYNYNTNDNTLAYKVRRQSSTLKAIQSTGRYQFLFTYDENYFLSMHTTSNSTATTKTLTSLPFDPFGSIYYYDATTVVAAEGVLNTTALYQQNNTCDYRYAFNVSASVNSFTTNKSIYLKVTPQNNGKVILSSTSNPLTQTLPTSDDGYWYIYLGIAYSTYQGSLDLNHPVYVYKDGGIRTVSGYSVTTGVTYGPFTTDTNGLVPGPDSSLVAPGARYTDDTDTSKYWLNAMGNWQIVPSATFNQQGLMDPGHYTNVYMNGLRGYWTSDTFNINAANSWKEVLAGTIPANTSPHSVLFKITAQGQFSSSAKDTQHIVSIYYGGNHHSMNRMLNAVANTAQIISTSYYLNLPAGSAASSIYMMVYSSVTCNITNNILLIEPVAWL